MSQASFQKRLREKARQDRAAAKAERRDERRRTKDETSEDGSEVVDQDAVLAELAGLHARFEAGEIDLDELVQAREDITSRLDIR